MVYHTIDVIWQWITGQNVQHEQVRDTSCYEETGESQTTWELLWHFLYLHLGMQVSERQNAMTLAWGKPEAVNLQSTFRAYLSLTHSSGSRPHMNFFHNSASSAESRRMPPTQKPTAPSFSVKSEQTGVAEAGYNFRIASESQQWKYSEKIEAVRKAMEKFSLWRNWINTDID